MNLAVWIVSGVLAALYLMAGFTKLVKAKQDLLAEPRMSWVGDFTEGQVKGIGAVEVAGALGLVLPWLTGVAPILTPIAAVCLALIMVGALVFHVRRREWPNVPVSLVLITLLTFVAVSRFAGV
jgi:hypothetical protein